MPCPDCAATERFNKRLLTERNARYDAHELGALADELDEDNWATAAAKLRAAIEMLAKHAAERKTWARLVRAMAPLPCEGPCCESDAVKEYEAARQALRDLGVDVDALLTEEV